MDALNYDETGKISLDDIYNKPDPVSYFSTLRQLDYCIPQQAKPAFERVIAARRANRGNDGTAKIVDVGCSYGINAALLKHGYSLGELYEHYAAGGAGERGELLARDREFFGASAEPDMEVVGLDQSAPAIGYGVACGAMDGGIAADLETADAAADVREVIAGSDLVISTGCVGYVSEASLERVLEASLEKRPWMAHMVLRMFSYEGVAEMLGRYGYVTEKAHGLYPQRRFASVDEQAHVLGNLDALGVDSSGVESDGWYAAEFYLSRPAADAVDKPLGAVLGGLQRPAAFPSI